MKMIREYGYEYDAVLDQDLWNQVQGRSTKEKLFDALCFRSARDTLKAIAREFEPCAVLLPALSCDSMIFPFELYGHHICFYKYKEDYSTDLSDLKTKIDSNRCLLLYMNYFGNPSISSHDLCALRDEYPKLVFIEDLTHDLIWEKSKTFFPDYRIVSLRKWIAIPDGALLWGRITQSLAEDTSFSQTRLKAQLMRHEYFRTGNEAIKTEYRSIFSNVSDLMNTDPPSRMSAYSFALAKRTDWELVRKQRRRNATILSSILEPYVTLIDTSASCLYVPFLVDKRAEIQQKLSSMGIFNTIIWPMEERQKECCKTAEYTEQHMLAAPCDQRYSEADMEYIGKEMVKVIQNV